jgi:hypothetical protein
MGHFIYSLSPSPFSIFNAQFSIQKMYLISTEKALELVQKFKEGVLPKLEWTHEAHLMVGLYAVIEHKTAALDFMRTNIRRYNEAVGTVNSDTTGYHETLTVFWVWMLSNLVAEKQLTTYDEVAVDELIFEELFAQRNVWLKFYTQERVLSVEARKQFVEPDLLPMTLENYQKLRIA